MVSIKLINAYFMLVENVRFFIMSRGSRNVFFNIKDPLKNVLKVTTRKQLFWKRRDICARELASCIRPRTFLKRSKKATCLGL